MGNYKNRMGATYSKIQVTDVTVNNSETHVATDLNSNQMIIGHSYKIEGWIIVNANAAADIEIKAEKTVGSDEQRMHMALTTVQLDVNTGSWGNNVIATDATNQYIHFIMIALNVTSAGDVKMTFAQNVAHASNCKFKARSIMVVTDLN